VATYLNRLVREGDYVSDQQFIASPWYFIYALARARTRGGFPGLEGAVPVLVEELNQRFIPGRGWGNPCENAMSMAALLDLSVPAESIACARGNAGAVLLANARPDPRSRHTITMAARLLLKSQGADGALPCAPYFTERINAYYYGSAEAATGFFVEAIGKYRTINN